MSKKLPSLEQGLATLLKDNQQLAPATDTFIPAKEFAHRIVEQTPETSSIRTLQALRDQVHEKYGESKVGHLMTRFVVNRDSQLRTLAELGKEPILDLIAQGALPNEIAKAFEISYAIFNQFIAETCSDEEIRHAERLGADSMVSQGLQDLEDAQGRDEVAKQRALMDAKWKLAKSMNHKYIEQKPSTAVQVNNYNEHGGPSENPPFLQIVGIDKDNLPDLPEHKHTSDVPKNQSPTIVDGEFTLFEPD